MLSCLVIALGRLRVYLVILYKTVKVIRSASLRQHEIVVVEVNLTIVLTPW
jgi:nitrate reductase beta subunit